jgi:hypothetical protein
MASEAKQSSFLKPRQESWIASSLRSSQNGKTWLLILTVRVHLSFAGSLSL